jgi:phosphoserine phosphatase
MISGARASMNEVLVAIAKPGSGTLGAEQLELLAQFGAGAPRWLAHSEALEVDGFEGIDLAAAALRAQNLDAVVVPQANRRKRVLLADMDSTMIEQECIDELGAAAGLGGKISSITARAMRGEVDFEGALKERVRLLKGLDEGVIAKLLRERISYMPGAKVLLATMKAHGAYCALVSGGFTAFTEHVAKALGFDENRANRLLVSGGKLTGEVAVPILGKHTKVESLHRVAAARGVTAADVLAVGDGANDIPMLQAAGMGVALHAKPKVQEQAQFVINHGDLTTLLYLQGYARDEFATP